MIKTKQAIRGILHWLLIFGIDLRKCTTSFLRLPSFLQDLRELKHQLRFSNTNDFSIKSLRPYVHDKSENGGRAKGHYFHQDLFVAQRIHESNPVSHLDIGSRVDGFVAHVASFRPIRVLDIRPTTSSASNIEFIQADLMSADLGELAESCDSLSCLHVIEHFGLGRYGDPISINGHLDGLNALGRLLRPGGKLYFSTPIGPQRIEFNAHRVFSLRYLISYFECNYDLEHFSYVDDAGDFHRHVSLTEEHIANNMNCNFGCGIFELRLRVKHA